MSSIWLIIAKDEWRYWLRSKLAISVLSIGFILTLASVVVTAITFNELEHQRIHKQQTAEQTFIDQPDRHPHRMVHYGHYAFRLPSHLSILDPGVDAYTGNSIFLEGHRQNTAMFAEQRQGTGLNRIGSLSPAFVLQFLAPLLLIIVGFSVISREKEAETLSFMLAQGTSWRNIIGGKLLALFSVVMLMMLPPLIAGVFAGFQGESWLAVASYIFVYTLYLMVWALLVICASIFFARSNSSFTILVFVWLVICVIMPRIASSSAATLKPNQGKLETDFAVLSELRKLGDGHNASDPAFEKLKASLLKQYQVDSIEDLPINYRGVVAKTAEKDLTEVLNRFAEKNMAQELSQTSLARQFGWLSPLVAIRTSSMLIAGTSVETHHRFLRETEALRFNFVQSLNTVHIEQLSYQNDINRSQSESASRRARVSSENWRVLDTFEFKVDKASTRVARSIVSIAQLLIWIGALCLTLRFLVRRTS